MRRKELFFKVIELMKLKGFCPNCWDMHLLSKSGLKRYYCSECEYTIIVERDKLIFEWYRLEHGIRILRSAEIDSSKPFFMNAIKYLRENRKL